MDKWNFAPGPNDLGVQSTVVHDETYAQCAGPAAVLAGNSVPPAMPILRDPSCIMPYEANGEIQTYAWNNGTTSTVEYRSTTYTQSSLTLYRVEHIGRVTSGLLEGKRVSRVSTINWSPAFCNTPEFAQVSQRLSLTIG